MNQLPSVAALYEQMDQAKRTGPLMTNFYPTPDKLQRWIDGGTLYSMTVGNVLFVLRRDRDFLHLSYLAPRAEDLRAALTELRVPETLTVDVLGKREQVDAIAELFVTAGFQRLTTLHRMTRTATESTPATDDPEIELANGDDADALVAMMEALLDRHAEQIPDADDMKRTAAERKILVIRAGAAIAGMLVFEVTGQSSLLRHWIVDGAHRDKRIGARLIRRYFADCKDVRRFILWVISDNDNAIDRYKHYGYQHDGLIDQVLMRRAS